MPARCPSPKPGWLRSALKDKIAKIKGWFCWQKLRIAALTEDVKVLVAWFQPRSSTCDALEAAPCPVVTSGTPGRSGLGGTVGGTLYGTLYEDAGGALWGTGTEEALG